MKDPQKQFDLTEQFRDHFKIFNEILINELSKLYQDLPKTSLDRIKKMAEYNVPHGKLNRGLMVIEAFYDFNSGKFTADDLMKAFCLGWCIEWCQAYFLVADDVMDSSISRRGQPCWFRQPDVGLMAVNDALILRSSLNLLLKNQFKDDENLYLKFSELFREVELSTEMGQMLDMTNFIESEGEDFMKRYQLITKYKTSIYTFYLPFACAYLLTNQNSSFSLIDIEKERDILLDIGHLFQAQDDILDVFGDPKITGKIGSDIEEGKCTWLLCKCLSLPRVSESDRFVLKVSRDTKIVKEIYEKNEILNHFECFEFEIKKKIENSISKLSNESSSKILRKYLNKIIKRIK